MSGIRCQKKRRQSIAHTIWHLIPVICHLRGSPSVSPAPTACRHPVSGTVSLPSSGCFSPFPHGTRSLSVTEEYLGLEGGPPMFRQGCSCPALLKDRNRRFP